MTFLLILGLVCTLAAIATLIGLRLPKTHVAASRLRLDAPVGEVWDAVVDFSAYTKWRPGLARVEAGPVIDGRPTWYEYCGSRVKVQLQFAEFEPKRRLVTRLVGEGLPIFGAWDYQFAEDDGGTLLTITESDKIYNPLLRFLSRFIFPHHAAMDVFLIALARYFGGDGVPEHLSIKKSH
ncbi:MAG: SRPBCC family protein [Candidatus Methylumidiphilus sp.]